MSPSTPPIVVMGVSGSGKSTIGLLLAAALGADFIDADDLHPAANREKMAAGIPLDDEDREPWLEVVGAELAGGAEGPARVVACSALRRRYRDLIRRAAPDAFFVHLSGDTGLIGSRLAARHHEYMPPTLLGSQVATLEPLESDERGAVLDLALPPAELVSAVLALLSAGESSPPTV